MDDGSRVNREIYARFCERLEVKSLWPTHQGNILAADAEALVNTVNCVGIMGRGIALQFKNVFPENFKSWLAACKRNEVMPGKMFAFETGALTNPHYIINFPTKRHWKGKSRMEDIDAGLVALADEIKARNIRSIAVPALGSGLGGLRWNDVRPRIEAALRELSDVKVIIFEPDEAFADKKQNLSSDVPRMTSGRAALVGLMHRYLSGLLDPFISLLEVHKLMYFMQCAGQELRLNFTKGPYGPYAENLRHVLHAIEGHLVSGYDDGGDKPDKQLTLVPGALDDALLFLKEKDTSNTQEHFDKVCNLVEGFESPFGLELLATVHWVVKNEQVQTVDDVITSVYAWNEKKRQFSSRQIRLAIDVLTKKGWLEHFSPICAV